MQLYQTITGRGIRAKSPADAGQKFALRFARHEYGRRGAVRIVRLDSASMDGTSYHYDCFVGVPEGRPGNRSFVGRNIRVSVYPAE